jgi:hypothetical protein
LGNRDFSSWRQTGSSSTAFDWAVELSDYGASPVANLGRVAEIDFLVRHTRQGGYFFGLLFSGLPHTLKAKRDFSLRGPTILQEQNGKKKRRPAPFEMTVRGGCAGEGG